MKTIAFLTGKIIKEDKKGNLIKPQHMITAKQRFEQFGAEYADEQIPEAILSKGYDHVYRFMWSDPPLYVCERDGKKGVVNRYGIEVIPCIQDEIFEQSDADGVTPFIRDGLWGLYHPCYDAIADAIFKEVIINSEEYCQVLLEDVWGWVTYNGDFTTDVSQAAFGSWYDVEK